MTSEFRSSDNAASRGATSAQSSSAACSVGAIAAASAYQARSSETTTRRPSRPALSEASFTKLPLSATPPRRHRERNEAMSQRGIWMEEKQVKQIGRAHV